MGQKKLLDILNNCEKCVLNFAIKSGLLLFLLTILIICFDVLTRKIGYQLPGLGSTRLQELEWHLHTALFSFWIGVAYLKNQHVRIDLFVHSLNKVSQAKIEFFSILVLALPFCLLSVFFSFDFALISFLDGESSPSPNGLPYRWIPKFCIFLGLLLLLICVLINLIRLFILLKNNKYVDIWKLPTEK